MGIFKDLLQIIGLFGKRIIVFPNKVIYTIDCCSSYYFPNIIVHSYQNLQAPSKFPKNNCLNFPFIHLYFCISSLYDAFPSFPSQYNSFVAMNNQNCIDVKYVTNLSVPYLTRFFGSAGPVLRVDKNENSKYVTIEFANKFSVDKALRFEGRILDKDPIKIRVYKQKSVLLSNADGANTASSNGFSLRRKQHLINFKQTLHNSGKFKEDLWDIIFGEIRGCDFEENDKLINAMLLWRLGTMLMEASKHLQRQLVNMHGNYLQFQLQRELIDRMERRMSSSMTIQALRQSSFEFKDGRAWLWYSVPFPNTEEEESKVQAYSAQSRCLQRIEKTTAVVGHILRGLYSCSMVYAPEENGVEAAMELKWEGVSNAEDNFVGIVENIGVRDILYDLLSYEQPNSCIMLSESADRPQSFQCTLRLVGCHSATLQQRSWCDLFEAVVWKRWTSNSDYYHHIEIKGPSEATPFREHNLFFDEAQFSCEAMCTQYRKYRQFSITPHTRLFYIRKQKQPSLKQAFQKLYEDDVMNIYEEVQEPARKEHKEDEGNYHEEVVVNLCLIQVRPQGNFALNQLKLQHYLLDYIEESITGKGLIVASQEMAYKLASNIISREKDSRLFQFAHSRFQKPIGDQLWRLYCKQNERKIKNNLVHYQLGKR